MAPYFQGLVSIGAAIAARKRTTFLSFGRCPRASNNPEHSNQPECTARFAVWHGCKPAWLTAPNGVFSMMGGIVYGAILARSLRRAYAAKLGNAR